MTNRKKAEDDPSDERVPARYAEKAMSSLLRLHDDLVEEKEKRIDLYRRLMDREQELAELRSYVRLLESEMTRQGSLPPGAAALLPAAAPGDRQAIEGAAGPGHVAPAADTPAPDQAAPEQEQAAAARAATPKAPAHEEAEGGATEASSQPSSDPRGEDGSTPGRGRAPVVAWVPFNAGRR